MVRIILLIAGVILLVVQQYVQPISTQMQFIIFLTGIILLGIPHGAADLLVATQNSASEKKTFSRFNFFIRYLGRLVIFAATFWFFPLAANLLFILFAAYHFGETDLHQFKTNTFSGKLFVISYGLVILGVILLNHFEEVQPLLLQFDSGKKYESLISQIGQYRYVILSCSAVMFFASTFFYFSANNSDEQTHGQFLVQFVFIIFLLYNLPMILGFTFYFILWHSVLSLRSIVNYLRKDGLFSAGLISKQLAIYSFLAIAGISLFGLTGFMFVSNNAMMVYIFLGLAVLTAPHMEVIQGMYKSIRAKVTVTKEK